MREYVRFSRNKMIHRQICSLLDMLEITIITLFCAVLLFAYVFSMAAVQGDSMLPTLCDEDKLLVLQMYGVPENGDIVIIDAQDSTLLAEDGALYTRDGLDKVIVKRVIAVGGQTLDIDFEEGIVYLDQKPLEEVYINMPTTTPSSGGAFGYPLTVPEGYVFVMGDNRDVSKDSRYPDVGLIPESAIMGKVILRTYPWKAFGFV